jgi:hypothetical protein
MDLGRFSANLIGFVVVTIVVPWTLIWLLRRVGRRWSTGSLYDPEPEMEALPRPLRCRLNLFHRWRTCAPRAASATSAALTARGPATSPRSPRCPRASGPG